MTGKDNIQKIAFYQVIFPGNAGSLYLQRTSGIHLPPSTRVGAMRKYAVGAFLLDKNNPVKVIGRTREPILTANENEREGYVPNVIYTAEDWYLMTI